jgi:hypothetical protein
MITDIKNQPKVPIPDITDTILAKDAQEGQIPNLDQNLGFSVTPFSQMGSLEPPKTQGFDPPKSRHTNFKSIADAQTSM